MTSETETSALRVTPYRGVTETGKHDQGILFTVQTGQWQGISAFQLGRASNTGRAFVPNGLLRTWMERCGGHAPEESWEQADQMVQHVKDTIGANLQTVMDHPEGPVHTAPPAVPGEA
jgi:hypothetical protein